MPDFSWDGWGILADKNELDLSIFESKFKPQKITKVTPSLATRGATITVRGSNMLGLSPEQYRQLPDNVATLRLEPIDYEFEGTYDRSCFLAACSESISAVLPQDTPEDDFEIVVFTPHGSSSNALPFIVEAPSPQTEVSAGCFTMGNSFADSPTDEVPSHPVCLSAFKLDIYEASQREVLAYIQLATGANPDMAATQLSWDNANEYCATIGRRLPTEAEWEYAAQGATQPVTYPSNLEPDCAAFDYDCGDESIGLDLRNAYAANDYGLYGMAGGVWEWVADAYNAEYYSAISGSTVTDPIQETGSLAILRGGAYDTTEAEIRVPNRYPLPRDSVASNIGVRCAK